MTTEPDEVPPPSGLEPELAEELGPAAAGVDVLEEPLLEQAVTAAMPTTARAAIPLLAEILMVIWTSLRTGVIQFGLLTPVSRKRHPDQN
jgi:hypothetical protein